MMVADPSTRRQITQWLRHKLESGELKAGDKIPTTLELAAIWSTQEPTIQRALLPLVREGYLVRSPRRGTFVSNRSRHFENVGIYAPKRIWANEGNAFSRALTYEIQHHLEKADMTNQLFIDARPDSKQSGIWDALLDIAATNRLDALLAPSIDLPHMRWLNKLPIPVVYFASLNISNATGVDVRSMARYALDLLAEQGAKSVGLVFSVPLELNPDGTENEAHAFLRTWVEYARELGLEQNEEDCIFLSTQSHKLRDLHLVEQFGYDAMLKLLKKKNRPDGTFVYTDFAARGAIVACNYGADFSKDIKLALYRNSKLGLFCPRPAAFVELKTEKVAAAMIEQARRMRLGEPFAQQRVSYDKISAPSLK